MIQKLGERIHIHSIEVEICRAAMALYLHPCVWYSAAPGPGQRGMKGYMLDRWGTTPVERERPANKSSHCLGGQTDRRVLEDEVQGNEKVWRASAAFQLPPFPLSTPRPQHHFGDSFKFQISSRKRRAYNPSSLSALYIFNCAGENRDRDRETEELGVQNRQTLALTGTHTPIKLAHREKEESYMQMRGGKPFQPSCFQHWLTHTTASYHRS